MHKPELLVPAGAFDKMKYAFAYGADAVYAGVPQYSLRARENDFNQQKINEAIEYSHKLGKKIYLTMNIFPHNRKVDSFLRMLADVAELSADGLIMADPGMIMIAREKYPHINIHLSTQSNTLNWQTVKFWKQLGLKRIILSRELSIDEIKEIKQRVPDIELEAFVHGAVCIAYSGRCLLSNYFNHRDANQGTCTNACRWKYKLYSESENMQAEKDIYTPLKDNFYIEESDRPGSLMPIDEDEHGTYIMNAKDLCAIEILNEMAAAGIDSFKVEGRTKSVYYVSVITRAYREALDKYINNQPVPQNILEEVYSVANRGYVTGFLERNPLERGQNYKQSHSDNQTRKFVGIIDRWDAEKQLAAIRVRNRFEKGDLLELMTPQSTIPFTVDTLMDTEGNNIIAAHGGGIDVMLSLPENPADFALLRRPALQPERIDI